VNNTHDTNVNLHSSRKEQWIRPPGFILCVYLRHPDVIRSNDTSNSHKESQGKKNDDTNLFVFWHLQTHDERNWKNGDESIREGIDYATNVEESAFIDADGALRFCRSESGRKRAGILQISILKRKKYGR